MVPPGPQSPVSSVTLDKWLSCPQLSHLQNKGSKVHPFIILWQQWVRCSGTHTCGPELKREAQHNGWAMWWHPVSMPTLPTQKKNQTHFLILKESWSKLFFVPTNVKRNKVPPHLDDLGAFYYLLVVGYRWGACTSRNNIGPFWGNQVPEPRGEGINGNKIYSVSGRDFSIINSTTL